LAVTQVFPLTNDALHPGHQLQITTYWIVDGNSGSNIEHRHVRTQLENTLGPNQTKN